MLFYVGQFESRDKPFWGFGYDNQNIIAFLFVALVRIRLTSQLIKVSQWHTVLALLVVLNPL